MPERDPLQPSDLVCPVCYGDSVDTADSGCPRCGTPARVRAQVADVIREAANELEGGRGWPEYAADEVLGVLGLDGGAHVVRCICGWEDPHLPDDQRVVRITDPACPIHADDWLGAAESVLREIQANSTGQIEDPHFRHWAHVTILSYFAARRGVEECDCPPDPSGDHTEECRQSGAMS